MVDPKDFIRLLIADDHQMLIDGIKGMLSEAAYIQCVAEANNGFQVIEILKNNAIDIVLLDVQMPGMNGLETAKIINREFPDTKILVLSMHENIQHVQQFLKMGVQGYLLKNTGKDQLITALDRVQKGEIVIDRKISESVFKKESDGHKFIPQLTRREKEILQLIALQKTTDEIADELNLTRSTIEYHRSNLLIKFGVKSAVGLIKEAFLKGMIN